MEGPKGKAARPAGMPERCLADGDERNRIWRKERVTRDEDTGRGAHRREGWEQRKEPVREARREERPGRPGGRDVVGKKVRAQSESDVRVPVRAEGMKRSLRPVRAESRTGERDGSGAEAEAVNAKSERRMRDRGEGGSRTDRKAVRKERQPERKSWLERKVLRTEN